MVKKKRKPNIFSYLSFYKRQLQLWTIVISTIRPPAGGLFSSADLQLPAIYDVIRI